MTEAHEVKRNLCYRLWKKLRKVTFWTKRQKKHESKGKNVEERGANMDKEQDAHQPTDMDKEQDAHQSTDMDKEQDAHQPTDMDKEQDAHQPTDIDKEQDAHQPTDMDGHEETLHGEVEESDILDKEREEA